MFTVGGKLGTGVEGHYHTQSLVPVTDKMVALSLVYENNACAVITIDDLFTGAINRYDTTDPSLFQILDSGGLVIAGAKFGLFGYRDFRVGTLELDKRLV